MITQINSQMRVYNTRVAEGQLVRNRKSKNQSLVTNPQLFWTLWTEVQFQTNCQNESGGNCLKRKKCLLQQISLGKLIFKVLVIIKIIFQNVFDLSHHLKHSLVTAPLSSLSLILSFSSLTLCHLCQKIILTALASSDSVLPGNSFSSQAWMMYIVQLLTLDDV